MKRVILASALLLACGCSDGPSAGPEATETGASAAAAKPTEAAVKATDVPLTAGSCVEDNKKTGTGSRGEDTKACMVDACDQGDKKSCEIVKSFNGEMSDSGDSGADDPAEDATAK